MYSNCPRCSSESLVQRLSEGRVRCQHCGNEWIPQKVTKHPARSTGKVVQCPNCSLQSSFASQSDGQNLQCTSCGHEWIPSLPDSNKGQTKEIHRYQPIAFCSQCGRKVTEGTAFCSGCGHNLKESPETRTAIPNEPFTLICQRCGFEGVMSSPPLATDRVRCKKCGHEWYPSQKPSDRTVQGKEHFELVTEGRKSTYTETTHLSGRNPFSSRETAYAAESSQYTHSKTTYTAGMALGGILAIIGSFLPWAELNTPFGSAKLSAIADGRDGIFTLILGIVVMAFSVGFLFWEGPKIKLCGLLLAVSVLIFIIAVVDMSRLSDISRTWNQDGLGGVASVGAGLYVVLIGSIISACSGLVYLVKSLLSNS